MAGLVSQRAPALLIALSTSGCTMGTCGTASFAVAGSADPALLAHDEDPSTPAIDLVETCGINSGAFGSRRTDLGITGLYFDADAASDSLSANGDVALYLLPAADVFFLTEHLVVGNQLDISNLGGGGLHKPTGTAYDTYMTYGLLDGTIDVLDQRETSDSDEELWGFPVRWKLTWHLEYGDAADAPMQVWEGTDWVEVDDASSMWGELPYYPPDYSFEEG